MLITLMLPYTLFASVSMPVSLRYAYFFCFRRAHAAAAIIFADDIPCHAAIDTLIVTLALFYLLRHADAC